MTDISLDLYTLSLSLQLKQYQLDFEEERKAREEMVNVMRHLEARDKDSKTQIADLQKQINSLSTEKNYLAFQVEQLRSQLQQVGLSLSLRMCEELMNDSLYCSRNSSSNGCRFVLVTPSTPLPPLPIISPLNFFIPR